MDGFKTLVEGDEVIFDVEETDLGFKTKNIARPKENYPLNSDKHHK